MPVLNATGHGYGSGKMQFQIRAPPSDDEWVQEIYRPKEAQNMLVDRGGQDMGQDSEYSQ